MSLGSIGSFYFGPQSINVDITLPFLELELDINELDFNNSSNILLPKLDIAINPISPIVKYYDNISIDFIGEPVEGKSPLEVQFSAYPIINNNFTAEIHEYRWYFDYGNNPTEYTTVYTKTTSHIYEGKVGDTFDVRLEIILKPSEDRTIYCEKYEYIIITPSSKRTSLNRKINLTNYVPQYQKNSNVYYLVKSFEDYLNEMYIGENGTQITENIDDDGYINLSYSEVFENEQISVLDKIYRLRELHDVDLIDLDNIQYLANNYGYNINVNRDQFGIDIKNIDKYMRFMIGNLPNWYKIKTTRNSLKTVLFSFGLIGDIVYYYTKDYSENNENWDYGELYFDTYDNKLKERLSKIPKDWYPTSHFSVWYDINKSETNFSFDKDKHEQIVNAVESIRPINTVFNGVIGKYSASTEVKVYPLYRVTKYIKVESNNCDYWF